MSTVPLREWLHTAFLALVTALLLDYLVTTTLVSYATTPTSVTAPGPAVSGEVSSDRPTGRSRAGSSPAPPGP